jgi:hypothetical protein
MKRLMTEWRNFLQEEMKVVINTAKDFVCPPATQDLKLNTKNRDAAIHAKHIQYGPLNVNCTAFDISPRMDECMPGVTSDDDGRLGYCWMHHFKCHSARSCRTWAKGGPIKEDSVSYEWQSRNQFQED